MFPNKSGPRVGAGAPPAPHRLWLRRLLISGAAGLAISAQSAAQTGSPTPVAEARAVYAQAGAPAPAGRIDELNFAHLARLGLAPAPLCTDAVFVRRAFLDVIGTLPTAAEARAFLQDPAPDKRAALIDRLLARPEFADYWAMKWSDLLRVKAEFPVNLWPNAAQCYYRWIHTAVRDNLPYDRFARELLTANGSNFRVGPVNFYRAVQGRDPAALARAAALTFMGARAEKWPAGRLAACAPFFARLAYKGTGEWKEEIVFFDPDQPLPAGLAPAAFPDGTPAVLPPGRDPRAVFADWLIRPENPWFTRAIANRVWSWLLGRGLVQEPDDLRPDNPPVDAALLDHLAAALVAAHYDLKALFRLILNSRTYQQASPAGGDPVAEANFAGYAPRRLEAEVLIDAINQITGTTEKYSSAIPEPFTYVPEDQRSIALPDGSITSSFLENFGRPARDTGLESERNNRLTASQRLTLLNSTQIQRKLETGPKLQAVFRTGGGSGAAVDALYLTFLSRPPTDDERVEVIAYFLEHKDQRAAAVDVAWALLNSAEFLLRH